MADLISRLKLESGEFDSKIKRAGQELLAYSEHCKKMGLQMGYANEDAKKFAAALGSMATTSQSVRGKLGELTATFTDLSVMYKNMTEQEKNSTFGKNLSASLDQLKTRINDTKAQLNDVSVELGNTKEAAGGTGSIVDELTSEFGLNIKQLAGWGAAAGAAKIAFDVLKDAFFQSESNIDEWGCTVEEAKGAYDVFLNTINSGNWSNFFSNLSTAVQGARDLYDALDSLDSVKSNNQAAIALVQAEIQQLRVLKQQGEDVDAQLKQATANLARLQKQAVDAGKKAGNDMAFNTIRNGVNTMQGANVSDASIRAAVGGIMYKGQAEFDKYKQTVDRLENYSGAQRTKVRTISDSQGNIYNQVYKEFDVNLLSREQQKQYKLAKVITERENEIQQGIATYAQAVQEGAQSAREEFRGNRYALQGSTGSGSVTGTGNTTIEEKEVTIQQQIAALEKEALMATDERRARIAEIIQDLDKQLQKQKELVASLHQTPVDPKNIKAGDPSQMGITMPVVVKDDTLQQQVHKITESARTAMSNTDIADPLLEKFRTTLVDSNTLGNLMKTAIDNGITGLAPDFTALKEQIAKGIDIDDNTWEDLQNRINEKLKELNIDPIKLDLNTGNIKALTNDAKKMSNAWNEASSAVSAVGNALQQIENPIAKVVGIIAEAIASVAAGAGAAIKNHGGKKENGGPWAWIAFAAAATATLATTVTQIRNVTKGGFAEGGIVPGNSNSGDLLRTSDYGINSGELILNRAQQNSIASQLQDNTLENLTLTSRISGRDLILTIDSYQTSINGRKLLFSR